MPTGSASAAQNGKYGSQQTGSGAKGLPRENTLSHLECPTVFLKLSDNWEGIITSISS